MLKSIESSFVSFSEKSRKDPGYKFELVAQMKVSMNLVDQALREYNIEELSKARSDCSAADANAESNFVCNIMFDLILVLLKALFSTFYAVMT